VPRHRSSESKPAAGGAAVPPVARAEGIVTGHPSMPEFQLDPGQVNDVITYLKSLEN
jgi:hypothetical protein